MFGWMIERSGVSWSERFWHDIPSLGVMGFGDDGRARVFTSESEATDMANNTDYGLSATIWTEDLDKGKRISGGVDSGVIWINTWLLRDLRTPFGGMKNSGLGREGGDDALRFFTEQKNICIPK